MKTVIVASNSLETLGEITRILDFSELKLIRFSSSSGVMDFLKCNSDVDIAIIDKDLGTSDGKDTVIKIRGEMRLEALPIIIVSEIVKMREIKEFLELGASYFVPKPIKSESLREYVNLLLK